jgi:protein TonB
MDTRFHCHYRFWWGQGASLVLHAIVLTMIGWWSLQSARWGIETGKGGLAAARREIVSDVEVTYEEVAKPKALATQEQIHAQIRPDEIVISKEEDPVSLKHNFQTKDFGRSEQSVSIQNQPHTKAQVARAVAAPVTAAGTGGAQEAKPLYLKNPPPPYPNEARQKGQEGVVQLKVFVNPEGEADNVELYQSSKFRLLDEAAQRAVKKWRFSPATIGGLPINSSVIVPIRFELK